MGILSVVVVKQKMSELIDHWQCQDVSKEHLASFVKVSRQFKILLKLSPLYTTVSLVILPLFYIFNYYDWYLHGLLLFRVWGNHIHDFMPECSIFNKQCYSWSLTVISKLLANIRRKWTAPERLSFLPWFCIPPLFQIPYVFLYLIYFPGVSTHFLPCLWSWRQ